MLPRILGTYHYYVFFKDFKGSEADFARHMEKKRPNWKKGSTGYPGADLPALSSDFRSLVTAEGNDLLEALPRAMSYPGVGRAFATGILQLFNPQKYPLTNSASTGPFRKGGICRLSARQRQEAIEGGARVLGIDQHLLVGGPKHFAMWVGVLSEIRDTFRLPDFLILDWLLWHLPAQPDDTGDGGGRSGPGALEGAEVVLERLLEKEDPRQIAERMAAEDEARALLESKPGTFSEADMREFFRLLNTDYYKGSAKANRFSPAFVGHSANQIIAHLDAANRWIRRLWEADEKHIGQVLDEFWASDEVPFAGRTFPTAVLYLRDRGKFNIWLGTIAKGLQRVTGGTRSRRRTGAKYLEYNKRINDLREAFSIAPQSVDSVLWKISTMPESEPPQKGTGPDTGPDPPDWTEIAEKTFLEEDFFVEMVTLLKDKRQLVLYGPPGTGKTFVAEMFAQHFAGSGGDSQTVQFHPSYGYEEFVEGIRPAIDPKSGMMEYRVEPGIFKRFCDQARKRPKNPFVLVVDEINRGNLPRIFGELLYLLEKRTQEVTLPYSGERLTIPENVYLIGTMNSADHSIALVDMALRRRFHFKYFEPRTDVLLQWLQRHSPEHTWVADLLDELNTELLKEKIDKNLLVGHSHFMSPELDDDMIRLIWDHSIFPLLEEYFFTTPEKLEKFTFEKFSDRIDTSGTSGEDEEEDSEADEN